MCILKEIKTKTKVTSSVKEKGTPNCGPPTMCQTVSLSYATLVITLWGRCFFYPFYRWGSIIWKLQKLAQSHIPQKGWIWNGTQVYLAQNPCFLVEIFPGDPGILTVTNWASQWLWPWRLETQFRDCWPSVRKTWRQGRGQQSDNVDFIWGDEFFNLIIETTATIFFF